MDLSGLIIDRVIVHGVPKRSQDGAPADPVLSEACLAMPPAAANYLIRRLTNAFGSGSKSLQLVVDTFGPNTTVGDCSGIAQGDDLAFVGSSQAIARRLARAQTHPQTPGGLLMVVKAHTTGSGLTICTIIKAETHEGFRFTATQDLDFLDDLFLGPASRLYKVGIFAAPSASPDFEDPAIWQAAVFDSQLSSPEKPAALYFYEQFMGCSLPKSGAFMTRRFYIETKNFIEDQIETPEQQAELIGALHAYVRAEADQRISPTEFAQRFLDAPTALAFRETLGAQGVTMDAFQKSDESLKRYLDRRTQRFPGRITLMAPDAAFDEGLVTISAETSPDGTEETVIRIRNAVAN